MMGAADMADEKSIKVTTCKTVTNTRIERDRHGVTRREVKSEIKR